MTHLNAFPRLFLLGLLAAVVLPAGVVRAAEPGSAAMPPRTVRDPNPPLPADRGVTSVGLGVWIRADGSVERAEVLSGDIEWGIRAVETVEGWAFQPVLWEGHPIAARTEASFSVVGGKVISNLSPLPNLPGEPHSQKEFGLQPPVLDYDPDAILPLEGRLTMSTPQVVLGFVVEPDGTTGRFEVLEAASEQALRAALDLVSVERFRPGMIHGEAVAVEYTRGVTFRGVQEDIAGLADVVTVADPVFPYDRLLARDEGRARVHFRLGADGEVLGATVLDATHPDFGAALVAAVETWTFTPASAKESPERDFEYVYTLDRVPYGARRLADAMREGREISNRSAGLDSHPSVLARPAMVYPRGLLALSAAGSAKVEFVIDRSGLAQLPRVVEASAPEFGWAAATCVNGMRFAPITRGGKPVELRVVLPLQFIPPAARAAVPAS